MLSTHQQLAPEPLLPRVQEITSRLFVFRPPRINNKKYTLPFFFPLFLRHGHGGYPRFRAGEGSGRERSSGKN